MKITSYFSARHKCKMHLLDLELPNGKRIRRSFKLKGDAERVGGQLLNPVSPITAAGWGVGPPAEMPFVSDLVERYMESFADRKKSKTAARRVLDQWLELLPPAIRVTDLNTPLVFKFVEKRKKDKRRRADGRPMKPESINRELNVIAAMLNAGRQYYPVLQQWRPPDIPRPKVSREPNGRVWSEHEIQSVLGALFEPLRRLEQRKAQVARYRVGRFAQFCLLTGMRTGEVAKLKKENIDWRAHKIRVRQGKTGNVKTIGPMLAASMEILKEFAGKSTTDYVFFRGPNIPPKFYVTLRDACDRVGVLYGRDVDGGLRLYDARHTATTAAFEAGVNPAATKKWMGWSDSKFLNYYNHATDKARAELGKALDDLAGAKITKLIGKKVA